MTDAKQIIWDVLDRPSVFKNKEALYPEYIPNELPHREEQLKSLASLFRGLLLTPGMFSQRVLLAGGVGTGKTVTSKVFGRIFSSAARERGVDLRYVHVNCHRYRTLYSIVSEVARQLGLPIPARGLSAQEIYYGILEFIDRRDIYLIMALDEFDYFVNISGSDAVYFLIRTYDEYSEMVKRVNFIFITRDTAVTGKLDTATASYLIRNTIRFPYYTSAELYDILVRRRELAFYEGVVDDEALRFIADIEGHDKGGMGNARVAIEMLLLAGEAADKEGVMRVTLEHVRKANAYVNPDVVAVLESIPFLPKHELLVFLASIRCLKRAQGAYVRMGEVESEYRELCEEYNEQPRKHTQVYEYVMNLKRMGLIETRTSGKGYRGKSTLIAITNAPLEVLEEKVVGVLEMRRSEDNRLGRITA